MAIQWSSDVLSLLANKNRMICIYSYGKRVRCVQNPNRVLLTSIIFENDNTQCMLCVYQIVRTVEIDLFLIQFNM